MNENNIFITGPPRTGKSTLISEVVKEIDLDAEGLRSPDIREKGKRIGFKLKDIKTGEEGLLAHVDQKEGPKISKYRVNLDDLERITDKSLKNLTDDCDVVVIDEIGTMELFSDNFELTVKTILESEKPVLAVLHRNYINEYEKFGKIYDLGNKEYEMVKEEVFKKISAFLD